jgi:glucosamine-6-phosphate deaminase
MMIEFKIVEDYQELSRAAADWVQAQLNLNPASKCVFATGKTPLGLYKRLGDDYQQGNVNFSRCTVIELDDYAGIGLNDPKNLYQWLNRELLERVEVPLEQTIRFQTDADNPELECKRIERLWSQQDQIDFQVLGMGPNGHLGFNEPGSDFAVRTHLVRLTQESIRSSQRYWGKGADIPEFGFTLGLGNLKEVKKTLLLVSGEAKGPSLEKLADGSVSENFPASALYHFPEVLVIADRAAAGDLVLD